MAQLRSPGVVIKEKDLTNGRASIANANVAAFVGPFPKGELGSPVTIDSEAELIATAIIFPTENNIAIIIFR